MPEDFNTRMTLLGRLRNKHDESAWQEFVFFYKQYINAILYRLGVQNSDIEDQAQKVLLALWEKLPDFDYQPQNCKFRTWMSRIIRNKVSHYFEKQKRYKNDLERAEFSQRNEQKSNEAEIYQVYEQEWKIHVANLAWENLSKEFSMSALKCFEDLAKGKKASELAEELDLKVNSVFVNRKRVQEAFHKEIRRLNEELS
ncbi:probable RNA polymerase sigma-H factor [Lentisphaera araneosa HTCC2155]|uniref:Probable RNA polymerase sigma-H factor n=1 Tax=Lentisphaera araneosa HTCC2155 TaxID=313628 RepID=A6DHS4_9BACT|nr:sigma-70 family RNA polymerase sigma factor [Lentisphaera araneosa]EDM28578.1 probable RNA polymerase sigma-H factor [Lentisphaera araneosa HTCC2155]